MLPALFAGIVVCGLYLSMQNKLEAESLKGQVLVMKDSMTANTFVKYEDADKYFTSVAVEKDCDSRECIHFNIRSSEGRLLY